MGGGYCVKIGHDVWIGEGSFIASGVEIGNGAVIAAHSVVTKSIPAYAVAGGNPARIIKWRFDKETIEKLEASKWYEKEPAEVLKQKEALEAIVHFDIDKYKKDNIKPKKMVDEKAE